MPKTFDQQVAEFQETSTEELAARGRDALYMLEFGPEFLARSWPAETLDQVGLKLIELHNLTPDVLTKQDCLYLVTRLLGERRRSILAEGLRAMLNEHRKEERQIAKYVLAKIDARSRASAGQLLGAKAFPEGSYFDRFLSFSELRLHFYDFELPANLGNEVEQPKQVLE